MIVAMLKYSMAFIQKFGIMICLIASIATIMVNVAYFHVFIVGAIASSIYVVLIGFLLGKVFISDEDEGFARFMLGIFLALALLILVGVPTLVVYELNVLSLAAFLFVPLIFLIARSRLRSLNLKRNENKTGKDKIPYFSPAYVIPIFLMAYAEFLLIEARSGWVDGLIWDVVPSSFFVAYFFAGVSLFGLVLFSKTKVASKMLLVIFFSVLSITISSVVLYLGDIGDQMDHLGSAQLLYDYGSIRVPYGLSLGVWQVYWLIKGKGLSLLTVVVAKIFAIDVYWIHFFLSPLLSGVFIPLVAYKIVRMMGGEERVSLLAAFLSAFYSLFVRWGFISTANSLGFVVFFVSLYFSVLYLKSGKRIVFLLALITATASGFCHPLPGIMSFAFILLGVSVGTYRIIRLRSIRRAYIGLFISFLVSVFVLPAVLGVENINYLFFASPAVRESYLQSDVVAFSLEKLLKTNMWELVFGDYMNFSFKEILGFGIIPVLGLLGMAHALKEKNKYERILALFLFLAFVVSLIDYTMMGSAMVNIPFGPSRIWMIRDLVAIPFAAITVYSAVEYLEGGLSKTRAKSIFGRFAVKISARQVFAWLLLGFSLSALALSWTYDSYSLENTLHPTQLEADAAKYIDDYTDDTYVVLPSNNWMTMIGNTIVGRYNPKKYYVYGSFLKPSAAEMVSYMKTHQAGVGYFVVPSFRTPNFETVVTEASKVFGVFKVLSNENGQIYIFHYKIPPLPENFPNPNADVMAFYWDTPPSYMIQNGFGRVLFNPVEKNLDIQDFWGDLYQSIDLDETLIEGRTLGNLTSIEYSLNDAWVNWSPSENIPQAQSFKFRLGFENDSLVGIVEKGKSFVQLWWEGAGESFFKLRAGDFKRLYIPGLVGGETPYNVSSRDFGLLYTLSRTSDVVLQSAYNVEISGSSLTYGQIAKYCKLSMTSGYMWYDFYVQNNATLDKWAYIEVWLPDRVYMGIGPSLSYSLDDGQTWAPGKPLKTLGGAEVNWLITTPRKASEEPVVWASNTQGVGENYMLPAFTDSGGGQNRLLVGLYLPARDKALLRLSVSVYYVRPLEITYVFRDSDLSMMEVSSIKLYNYGTSYVGGLESTIKPTSLAIIEDEKGSIKSILVSFPPDVVFSLLFTREVDTVTDTDGNGIPDSIEA